MLGVVPLQVNVQREDGSLVSAILDIAELKDMHHPWTFNWLEIWRFTEDEGSPFYAFIKISLNGEILGLMKVCVYPRFLGIREKMEYIEISMIETFSREKKTAKPIGKWLVWYACKLADIMCSGNDEGSVLELNASRQAAYYYCKQIGMEDIGHPQFPSSPEIENQFIRFRFTRTQAEDFCQQLQDKYGKPIIPTDCKPKTLKLEAEPVH